MGNNGRRIINPLSAHNPFSPTDVLGPRVETDQIIEAVVLDVIVNDSHPEYSVDGYNIGVIKYRALKHQSYRNDAQLHWAFPLETNYSEYPMINEIVHIIPSLNRTYYTHKINTSNRVTSHPMVGIEAELQSPVDDSTRAQSFKQSVSNPTKVGASDPANRLGSYFVDQESVYRLRHDEGDVIFEGRSGSSIRLGAAWTNEPKSTFKSSVKDQAANLLLRVGPWASAPRSCPSRYGLVKEDINEDKSSIYLTEDQIVPLTYATKGNSVHGASIDEFPAKLDKNQIIINTDRFVVNTKTDKIFGFSKKGIHWTTVVDFTVDAGRDYVSKIERDTKVTIGRDMLYKVGRNTIFDTKGFVESTAGSRHSFISPKVYVGMRSDETEPIPAGATLAKFLEAFIDAHLTNAASHVITSMGPGVLSPKVIQALTKLKVDVATGKFASFNSSVGYIKK